MAARTCTGRGQLYFAEHRATFAIAREPIHATPHHSTAQHTPELGIGPTQTPSCWIQRKRVASLLADASICRCNRTCSVVAICTRCSQRRLCKIVSSTARGHSVPGVIATHPLLTLEAGSTSTSTSTSGTHNPRRRKRSTADVSCMPKCVCRVCPYIIHLGFILRQ